MENQSIICFANDWESDPTSKHQVMKILSGSSNKILWINSIGMRNPTLSKTDFLKIWNKMKGWFKGLQKVNENLYHFTPIVLPFPASKLSRKINKYILILMIAYYKRKIQMKDVQLWTFMPNIVELIGNLGETYIVYYCVDEWSKFSFMDGNFMQKVERQLLKKADLVITSAGNLYQDKVKVNPNTHLVSHGVDFDYFSKALNENTSIADDIAKISKPIIGFFGLIHEWIDLGLIEALAKQRPEWSFVMIGQWSVNVDKLKKLNNIHFLGQKPYSALINYCKAFDVGLIPFRLNDLTVNVNPIKLREYLAAGIPVVSTRLPEVEKYSEIVEICDSADEFVIKIENYLKHETGEEKRLRSEGMREEDWNGKVEEISNLILSSNQGLA